MPTSDYWDLVDKSDEIFARMRRTAFVAAPLCLPAAFVLGIVGLLIGSAIAATTGSGREIAWGIAFLLFPLPMLALVWWGLVQGLRMLLAEGASVRQGVRDCRWTGARALTAPLIGWGIPAFVAFIVSVCVLVMAVVAVFVVGAFVSASP